MSTATHLNGEREEINLLKRLDLHILDQATEFGDRNPLAEKSMGKSHRVPAPAGSRLCCPILGAGSTPAPGSPLTSLSSALPPRAPRPLPRPLPRPRPRPRSPVPNPPRKPPRAAPAPPAAPASSAICWNKAGHEAGRGGRGWRRMGRAARCHHHDSRHTYVISQRRRPRYGTARYLYCTGISREECLPCDLNEEYNAGWSARFMVNYTEYGAAAPGSASPAK